MIGTDLAASYCNMSGYFYMAEEKSLVGFECKQTCPN